MMMRALRGAGLLQHADWVRYKLNSLSERTSNEQFIAERPGFSPPPPHLLYEISSSTGLTYYWNDGLRMSQLFWKHLEPHVPAAGASVCEWGCGVGRIIRHLRGASGNRIGTLAGLDRNRTMIEWCRSAIPGIDFRVNSDMPPTDLADGSFDAVYCWSVFTHLSEAAHQAWMAELLRIVKPGGVVLFTTNGSSANLVPAEKSAFDRGELVVRRGPKEGGRIFLAYASPAFVRKLVGAHQVVSYLPNSESHLGQDLWVVRRV